MGPFLTEEEEGATLPFWTGRSFVAAAPPRGDDVVLNDDDVDDDFTCHGRRNPPIPFSCEDGGEALVMPMEAIATTTVMAFIMLVVMVMVML